jgi:predicted nuclease of predicted toxin-antitoxin system
MKFLVDAQLPRRLARWLAAQGVDALHTAELPDGNASTDDQVIERAERENRIVITKDADFVQSHILQNRPRRLWLISTGNTSNAALESLIERHWLSIQQSLASSRFVELSTLGLIVHG